MTTFTTDDREEEYKKILAAAPNQPGYEDAVPIPFAGWVNTAPPHIVDSGASVMNKPIAYINVEERKLEWAVPIEWHTPTIAKMDKVPLYTNPVKELTDEEIYEIGDEFVDGANDEHGYSEFDRISFARAILRKAQEK